MEVKQISVFLENRAGQIAAITETLALSGVDLRAISVAETSEYGVLRLVVNNSQKAVDALKSKNLVVNISDVTVVEVPDQPGGLNRVLSLFADKKVDIEYMYSLFNTKKGTALMVFKAKDVVSIKDALCSSGIETASAEELGLI